MDVLMARADPPQLPGPEWLMDRRPEKDGHEILMHAANTNIA